MGSIVVMMRAQGNHVMTGGSTHWGWRKNTLKRRGSQATSGHSASSSPAEELATGTAGSGCISPVIKTTQHTNQWFNHCISETDDLIGFGGFQPPSAVRGWLWEQPSLLQQTPAFPSCTFILRLWWLQLLYQNILEHRIPLRLVFIDIYGSARRFQWVNRAFPHSV